METVTGVCKVCGEQKPAHTPECRYSIRRARKQQLDAPEEGSGSADVLITAEELEEINARARELLADPIAMQRELQHSIVVAYLLDKLFGLQPNRILAKTGPQISTTCRGRMVELAQKLYESVQAEGPVDGDAA